MSTTDRPTAQPEPPGIPPYGERDLELATRALSPAGNSSPLTLREVAGAIATARAEGYREGQLDERARRQGSEGDTLVIDDTDDEAWA